MNSWMLHRLSPPSTAASRSRRRVFKDRLGSSQNAGGLLLSCELCLANHERAESGLDFHEVSDVQVYRGWEIPRDRHRDGSSGLPKFTGEGHCATSEGTSIVPRISSFPVHWGRDLHLMDRVCPWRSTHGRGANFPIIGAT